ncbi:MAG: hypothetical protein H7A20_06060 [Rhodanobacteraceae bacterium]|nr:hypothetical protein [Rhodanobacteraceae bacterium]HPF74584.1 hypothetical protein [Xanthomonadaceae bacterium]HRY00883.1 hypothetical protein [Xanthomonadaceae bacterium]
MASLKKPSANSTHSDSPRQAMGEHFGESKDHLMAAASAAADTLRNANSAAVKELRSGGAGVREELGEAASSGQKVAGAARDAARDEWNAMKGHGRNLLSRSEQWVQERPLAALGIAAAGGFILSRMMRRR